MTVSIKTVCVLALGLFPIDAVGGLINIRNSLQQQLEDVCNQDNHPSITALDKPKFHWDNKADRHPRDYVLRFSAPYGRKVAGWQQDFFDPDSDNSLSHNDYKKKPQIEGTRLDAATIITFFYPVEDRNTQRKPLDWYYDSFKNLAATKEQIIIFVPPGEKPKIEAIANEAGNKYVQIVTEFPTLWDIPTNIGKEASFTVKEPLLFAQFDGWQKCYPGAKEPPESFYVKPHYMAAYNAKAYLIILWTDRPYDEHNVAWGMFIDQFLDENKLARALELTEDTGIVMGEYGLHRQKGPRDITNKCWSDPKKYLWDCFSFVFNTAVGSSLGMLNVAVRFMKTVDDMDANDLYTGREEFILAFLAMRYPNTIFSVPRDYDAAPGVDWAMGPNGQKSTFKSKPYPLQVAFSGYGGSAQVPPINDPIQTIFCPKGSKYETKNPNLKEKESIVKNDPEAAQKAPMETYQSPE
ncbi:Uu.00g017790.m01.CDS01 [Anthostomella pinea]|uniref:Uu.00g017790.m01.CDS01 n=1 Tax=Anthostomella pinea TaxID=933095 RepID=A0AAI8VZJ3_9PEZI|nr:Uu.00g017790.m01.CDS01 [Anthostomella pinea]